MATNVRGKSIFLSSTYSDLKDLRSKVVDWLQSFELVVVNMENFPGDSAHPADNSLKMLDKCHYFMLILGHRYGNLVPGKDKSITHEEYERAKELLQQGKLDNIFIFSATNDFPTRFSEQEPDDLRKELIALKNEIRNSSYIEFSTEEELFKGIARTFMHDQSRNSRPAGKQYLIFEALDKISDTLDSDAKSKLARRNYAMHEIINSFKPLIAFRHDADTINGQPLLKNIQDILDKCISPQVTFDKNPKFEGRIDRWGIRHVIFRVDTAIKLMGAITNNDDLRNIGEEIGRNASADLVENVVYQHRLLPASIGAFIKLFDYWDSSGGWGVLEYHQEHRAHKHSESGKWILLTRNNFLRGDQERPISAKDPTKSSDHLYAFWKGYIMGAMNFALEKLSTIYSELPSEEKGDVFFPAYSKVKRVERLKDNDPNTDIFEVYFEVNPNGWALEKIAKIRDDNKKGTESQRLAMLGDLGGLVNNLKRISEQNFNSSVASFSEEDKQLLEQISTHQCAKDQSITACIELVNRLIQAFLNL